LVIDLGFSTLPGPGGYLTAESTRLELLKVVKEFVFSPQSREPFFILYETRLEMLISPSEEVNWILRGGDEKRRSWTIGDHRTHIIFDNRANLKVLSESWIKFFQRNKF
jgi:hypothetical protein